MELAGALGEIARHTLKHDFRAIRPEEAQILILDGSPRVLPSYPEDLSRHAETSLGGLGVRVRNGVMVVGVDRNGVTFRQHGSGEQRIATRTVLWAGAVAAGGFGRTLSAKTNAHTDKLGRLTVNPDLTIAGFPQIYVVGDLAAIQGPDGKPLPGVAQIAIQSGAYVASAIVQRLEGPRDLPPFRYFDRGDLAVIGRGAVARIFGMHLWGLPAWLVWLFVHLVYLVQFQSLVVVFIRWGFQYITFSRGARLITECEPDPAREK